MIIGDWSSWLAEWNRVLLQYLDPEEEGQFPYEDMTPEIVVSGWLGYPAAAESEIIALETRLGMRLPPSYRSFLRVSNGFRQPGNLVPRLFRCAEVDWLRARHQTTIDIWLDPRHGTPPPDAFERFLPGALQISAEEISGTAMYLLNPAVVNDAGEWEAFYFAHWVPGAERFPSFADLMQREYETFLYIKNDGD